MLLLALREKCPKLLQSVIPPPPENHLYSLSLVYSLFQMFDGKSRSFMWKLLPALVTSQCASDNVFKCSTASPEWLQTLGSLALLCRRFAPSCSQHWKRKSLCREKIKNTPGKKTQCTLSCEDWFFCDNFYAGPPLWLKINPPCRK